MTKNLLFCDKFRHEALCNQIDEISIFHET